MVEVNGKPMDPDVLPVKGVAPKSIEVGKASNAGILVDASVAQALVDNGKAVGVSRELSSHAKSFGFRPSNIVVGAVMTLATGVAAAAEPDATPASVGRKMVDAHPVLSNASSGNVCGTVGAVAGTLSAIFTGAVVGTATMAPQVGATVGTAGLAAPATVPGMVAAGALTVTAAGTAYEVTDRAATSLCNSMTFGR